MPSSAARSGGMSDAESVTMATRPTCGPLRVAGRTWAVRGLCADDRRPRPVRHDRPATLRPMDRSLWAVLAGTFTLRFSTGLTGAMLAFYLAKLPEHGGEAVSPVVVGAFSATFFMAELALSPLFGILSDRLGHHRVMLYGPIFRGVAVVITALTTNLWLLAGTRWLEGSSTAASIPSILGYIAIA